MAKPSNQQTSSDEAMSSEEEPINEQINEEEGEEELEAVARSADSDDDEAAGDAEGDGAEGDEADEIDDEYRVETASRKKRASKKSKEPVTERLKPVCKRNRSNDTPEQSTQEPCKKFSHSTGRNKRCLNKDLLNMPEDEIDFKRLPIRDIILLAEYKERSDNPFHGEYSNNEEDGFSSEQDRTYDDDQPSSSLFNHQSFMDRAPNSRWSNQDIELFYEQFGTGLSMIQQLFPGRTRHRVKLKYKKEERQHPLSLHEALSCRPKEKLQEVAATQEEQESYKDDPVDVLGEGDAELKAETNDEVTKPKQDEDAGVEEDQEENVADDHRGPLNSGDSDEDVDIWSSYRSGF